MEKLNLRQNLPLAGIVSFSLCSCYALYHLLLLYARDDTWLFLVPAVVIELFSAWAVYNVVEQARQVTKSNISDQDRRFYSLILAAFAVVATPTLAASVWANTVEFGGNIFLGFLFPAGTIGCAVGLALPETVKRYAQGRKDEKEAAETKRKQKELDRQQTALEAEAKRQQTEMNRQQTEMAAELDRQRAEARRKFLAGLGAAGQTLALYEAHPEATQAEIAALADVSERTIRNHLNLLEAAGLVARDNGDVKVI